MLFPEEYRSDHPLIPICRHDQEGGFFRIPHPEASDCIYLCVATAGKEWEHVCVAISPIRRCPTWEEMCFIKSVFWHPEETVMQLHPAESEWISNHPYALHLWRPMNQAIPLPPSKMVGIR